MRKYLLAVSLVLFAAACSNSGKQKVVTYPDKNPTPQNQTQNSTPDQTAGWNTYTSPAQLGFSIQYPPNFGFNTDFNQVQGLSYIPICDENMVACIYLKKDAYPGTNFEGAGVSVSPEKAYNTEAKCYSFSDSTSEAQTTVADVTIGNTIFKSATGGGGAAGHFDKLQVYRNFHNGTCYEISQDVAQTDIGNYPPGTVTQFNQDEVWQKLVEVIRTFSFSQPSLGDWQVENNTVTTKAYGFSFSLPKGFTVDSQDDVHLSLKSTNGTIGIQVLNFKFDKNNIQNLGGTVTNPIKVNIGNKVGYSYGNGDGPWSSKNVQVDLNGKTLEIGFESNQDDPHPQIIENQALMESVLKSFVFPILGLTEA